MKRGKLSSRVKNLLVLHATVFIWGFTGLLGALISVSAIYLVWYRVIIAFIALYIYFIVAGTNIKVSKNALISLIFTGAVVALHWVLFFYAIKLSTVSVTLVCLSSLTLFTSFLEPMFSSKKVSKLEVLTGLSIIAGISLIFEFEARYTLGIICALTSALCASIFSIINSKQIKNRAAPLIAFYELAGAALWISVYLAITEGLNTSIKLLPGDLFYLLILGTICTALAYVAGVSVMKELSAFRVALITNLEPVYGIILAWLFLGKKEQMTPGFYFGATIILSAVFLHPYLKNKLEKRKLRKRLN